MKNSKVWIDVLVRHSKLILLLNLFLVVLVGYGVKNLYFQADYKIFFGKDDPNLAAEEKLESTYGKSDNIFFAVSPKNGAIFTTKVLPAIEQLTELAWQIPYSRRVDSITNHQYPRVEEDDIFIEGLIQQSATYSQAQLEEKKRIALNEIGLVGRLVSPSGAAAGVNVTLDLPEKDIAAQQASLTRAREVAGIIESEYPEVSVYLAGIATFEQTLSDVAAADAGSLIPFMFVLLLVLLSILLRSVSATICTTIIILISVIMGMGFAGWAKMAINNVNISAPTIIMTLAISDSVHIFNTFLKYYGEGYSKSEALAGSLKLNIYAVFLTSATTVLGFLTMNFSESPPFRELGNISAIGALGALWATVFILPGLVQLMPFNRGRSTTPLNAGMTAFADFVVSHQNKILWGFLGLIIFTGGSLARLELNDDPIGYFSKETPVRQASEFIENHLSGSQVIYYSLDGGGPDTILNPEFLQSAALFTDWLRSQEEVVNVESFTDILKRLNQIMHNDDPGWHRLPDEKALAAQYFLMYELSLPYGLDPGNQVSRDKSAIRIGVTLANQRSRGLIAFEQKVQEWFTQNITNMAPGAAAGYSVIFAHVGQRNTESMISGSFVAIVLISLSLILAFRSIRFGLLSLIPNLFPALVSLGIWGLFAGQINMAASVVFSLTLGIVVDDTIHLMVKYIDARKRQGLCVEASVRYALSTVGTALVATSVVLAAGFLVMAFSDFTVNSTAGKLVAITIAIALLMDMVLLPALLLKFGKHLDSHGKIQQS